MRRPNVFSIPAGAPFLPTLVDALAAGRFAPIDMSDPMALADVTILLPTRRAARVLRQLLIERNPSRAALLPRIQTLGDVDEEEHLLAVSEEDPADALVLPPVISRLERSLVLTELVMAWGRAAMPSGAEDQSLVPSSAADGMKLAGDLGRLIDDMATAGISWDALGQLAPDEYAGYWQQTLDFLKIAGEQWPRYLAEQNRADPAARRDQLLRLAAGRLGAAPLAGPIIAAGSTGSIPATAALLKVIAGLPQGAVVLPGLDTAIDDEAWEAIGEATESEQGAPSHPQFGLKRLIAEIGILRADVETLGDAPPALAQRSALIGEAMRPAATTEKWAEAAPAEAGSLNGISLIEARNEQEEALAIAVALRESLETPGRIAALVTPDRTLARRVAVALQRWNIRVDDSAGQPLDATPPGVFVRLLAEAAFIEDATALMGLAKHPLARFGESRRDCRRAAEVLEVAILRGTGGAGSIATLAERLIGLHLRSDMGAERFVPRARKRLGKKDWERAENLARALGKAIGPLEALKEDHLVTVAELARRLAAALEAAADGGHGEGLSVWDDRAGDALAELLAGLMDAGRLQIPPREFPAFLTAAMAGVTIAPELGTDPRIHIWGTLEARLQSADLLILGGLDEGVWPGEIRTDAWLSRRMRTAIGLPAPERRIGLAAHDFTEAMANERVIVTRSERRGGTPTVTSRWLQRFEAIAGKNRMGEMTARGAPHLAMARDLDAVPPADVRPEPRPQPRPPLAARPRELSVTTIETLIRDPYAVYARRVLQLEPLDPIGQRADPRLRGSLIHEAFADFTKQWKGPFGPAARDKLLALWRSRFVEIEAFPEVHAVWLLKAEWIADWMIQWEAARAEDVASRHAEISGKYVFSTDAGTFALTGRADRIDVLRDGRAAIYDYKTGALATAKQVLLFQPQLALEGAMLREGAFEERFKDRSLAELAWIGLGRIGKDEPMRSAVVDDMTADSVAAAALQLLRRLIEAYENPAKGYVSQARPMFERRIPGDYDHLARVNEWRYAARPLP